MYVWGASPPSHAAGAIYIYTCVCPTHYRIRSIFLFNHSATGKRKAASLQVQRSSILPPCVSQFYAHLRFSATRDTTSSTDNSYPSAFQCFQRLLNGTPYGYLRVRHRPAMCVSLPMNASCYASVLPSTHDYAYRAYDTSTTANRITPAHPKMLSIALVCMHAHCVCACVYMYMYVCIAIHFFNIHTIQSITWSC